jgi:hypothetical protein
MEGSFARGAVVVGIVNFKWYMKVAGQTLRKVLALANENPLGVRVGGRDRNSIFDTA